MYVGIGTNIIDHAYRNISEILDMEYMYLLMKNIQHFLSILIYVFAIMANIEKALC